MTMHMSFYLHIRCSMYTNQQFTHIIGVCKWSTEIACPFLQTFLQFCILHLTSNHNGGRIVNVFASMMVDREIDPRSNQTKY